MSAFTVSYQVEVSASQKDAIKRAAQVTVNHWVNVEKRNITMTVIEEGNGNGIAAVFHENIEGCDHNFSMGTVFIGKKGGIHYNGLA